MTAEQKTGLANALAVGWKRYTDLFGEPPHGTKEQLAALLELTQLDDLARGIGNKAIARWYAQGLGKESAG